MKRTRKQAHPRSLAQATQIAAHMNHLAASGVADAVRMDADETNMLALELEQMRSRVYEAEYPEIKARKFIPVMSEIDPGAETFSWRETNYVGKAKVIRNYADDPESVETSSEKQTNSVLALGDAFEYSIQDIRRSAFSGQPLSARKAMAARRVWERGLDDIAALGAPEDGIATGLLNKPVGTSAGQIRNTVMTASSWLDASSTGDLMVTGLNQAVQEMIEDSKELYTPNLLLLTTAHFLRLSHKRMSADNSETALEAFLRTNPWIEDVQPWNLLKAIDGSTGNNSRGLLMRKDPDVAELVIPQEFEILPPQVRNYAFKVLAHGRTAGTVVYRPLGLRYLTGMPNDPNP
jgi:hypothetical protein